MGQHASETAQVNFEDCRVPAGNLRGEDGMGQKLALSSLQGGRIGIASQAVGMARAAFEAARAYAKQRESFGQPIFNHQAVQFKWGRHRHPDRGRAPAHLARREPEGRGSALPESGRDGQALRQRNGRAGLQ